jgi:hypothetical protein
MFGKLYCDDIKAQLGHLTVHLDEIIRILDKEMHLPQQVRERILYHIRAIEYCNQQIGYNVEDFFNPTNINVYK